MLKGKAPMDQQEVLDIMELLERFAIGAYKDRDIARVIFNKWQETAKLAAPKDKRHIGKGYGEVIGGKTLTRLYKERIAADSKRAQAAEKKRTKKASTQQPPTTSTTSTKVKRVTIQLPESSDDELETWDSDTSSSSSSASTLSVITVSTPLPPPRRGIAPQTPPSPSIGLSRRSSLQFPSISPTPRSRVTRSRSKYLS